MRTAREKAPAKINLTLDVLSLREDGYHEMDMVMVSVDLYDHITITLTTEQKIRLRVKGANLPTNEDNLAYRAAAAFLKAAGRANTGVLIDIDKHIPVCAGTAGGSSDAAAVLRLLTRVMDAPLTQEELFELAEGLGSDVPYCLLGTTARAQGRGEILTALNPLPPCHILLCKPDFDISTAQLFARLDEHPPRYHPNTEGMLQAVQAGDLYGVTQHLENVFERVLPKEQWEVVAALRRAMLKDGAIGTAMSGTGPTVFGIFEDEQKAKNAERALKAKYRQVFLCKPV